MFSSIDDMENYFVAEHLDEKVKELKVERKKLKEW